MNETERKAREAALKYLTAEIEDPTKWNPTQREAAHIVLQHTCGCPCHLDAPYSPPAGDTPQNEDDVVF